MPFRPCVWTEVCHVEQDPGSGSPVMRLTSSAAISHNIYCEQPYASPDGKRVAILRSVDFNRDYPWCDLLVASLGDYAIAYAQRGIHSQVVNAAWGEHVFYWKPDGGFYRLSLDTLDEALVFHRPDLPAVNCGLSISPDGRSMAYGAVVPGERAAEFGIVRVDLATGDWRFILKDLALVNPHTQYEPTHGDDLLIQLSIDPRTRSDGTVLHLGNGSHLALVDAEGGDMRRLPIGPPHTSGCTGHQVFIPGTDRVLFTTWARHDMPTLGGGRGTGNLFVAGPGDERPRLFDAPEHEMFLHVSVSRCGRFFVSDVYAGLRDPVPLVVGCLASGKYRTLLRDGRGSHGPYQWGHAHAYFTADNRYVVFNSDYQGHGQVYAAGVPEGFLESLL